MFTTLGDTRKAAIFAGLLLATALGAALLIRALDGAPELVVFGVWELAPLAATLVMLLVVTREGHTGAGWRALGLHRLGLRTWGLACGGTLLISAVASAAVWASPLAAVAMPPGGVVDAAIGFVAEFALLVVVFSLGEEIAIRGYLLPKLLPLGRRRALALSGLVWATWHLPLIFLTTLYHTAGHKLLVLPLFYGTIVAASFLFGLLRLATGSIWPALLAHAAHNAAWGTLGAFTATASPVLVEEYLVGDNGLLILLGTALGAVAVARLLRGSLATARAGGGVAWDPHRDPRRHGGPMAVPDEARAT
jgi:membrane protease YdiL (CAAX protease family)